VIVGLDVSAWGRLNGMDASTACGYIAACMDMLADFRAGPERRGRIRMVEIEPIAPLPKREAAD